MQIARSHKWNMKFELIIDLPVDLRQIENVQEMNW